MKWLSKWIFERTKEGSKLNQEAAIESSAIANTAGSLGRPSRMSQNGLHFTMYKATGGYVVEYNTYDTMSDRGTSNLHIITSDQDLGQQLSHIITFEALQR